MNIYKISQSENNDWDTYSDAVVVTEDENQARQIHPDGDTKVEDWDTPCPTWATSTEKVKVELIGIADSKFQTSEVICASFRAG